MYNVSVVGIGVLNGGAYGGARILALHGDVHAVVQLAANSCYLGVCRMHNTTYHYRTQAQNQQKETRPTKRQSSLVLMPAAVVVIQFQTTRMAVHFSETRY